MNVFKSIVTKYHPAGMKRDPRYSATDGDGNRVVITEDPEWNDSMNQGHRAACEALCKKLDWHGSLVEGALCKVGRVWVWRQSGVSSVLVANEITV